MIETLEIRDKHAPLSAVDVARVLLANQRESHEQVTRALRAHRRLLLQLQRGDRPTKQEIVDALADLHARDAQSAAVAGMIEALRDKFEAAHGR